MRISYCSSDGCSSDRVGQLLLCRMDVGIGEAEFTPALVSMISDRFNANKRAAVFSLIAIGVPIGGALAAVLGGAMAQAFGWRLAFVAVGLPGLVLALILFRTVPEPARTAAGEDDRSEEHTSELQSLMRISSAVFCLK